MINGVVDLPLIIVTKILIYPESSAAVYTGQIYNTSDSIHSDRTDSSLTPNSFSINEKATKQAYLNFQADLLPTRLSSAKDQDSLST